MAGCLAQERQPASLFAQQGSTEEPVIFEVPGKAVVQLSQIMPDCSAVCMSSHLASSPFGCLRRRTDSIRSDSGAPHKPALAQTKGGLCASEHHFRTRREFQHITGKGAEPW